MRALALAALVACSNGTANAPVTQAPPPAAPPTIPAGAKGRVVTERFASAALGVDKAVIVYLPAGYDANPATHWPVFYYLHGLGGDETNWLEAGKLDAAADQLGLGAIVVMPDGDDGFYSNSDAPIDYDACIKDGTGLMSPAQPKRATCVRRRAYEDYITKDLIGWVDATYRTIAAREGRGVAGLSMGGFGALELAMRNPQLFAAAASHSGVDALLYAGPHPYVAGKAELLEDVTKWGVTAGPIGAWIRSIFGKDVANWRAHDPAALAQKLAPGTLALYLDCGTEDEFALHDGAAYLHDVLAARRIEHEYYRGPGHHDFAFWRDRLPKSLAFLRARVTSARR